MSKKKKALGFGFIPSESQHHFLVVIPRGKNDSVIIYERFQWRDGVENQRISDILDKPRVELSKHKWKLIEDSLKKEFNRSLKEDNITVGKWKIGQVPVEKLFGKEVVLLAWAIEDCDPSVIPAAIKNWLGLSREERWWMFTMTNASTIRLFKKTTAQPLPDRLLRLRYRRTSASVHSSPGVSEYFLASYLSSHAGILCQPSLFTGRLRLSVDFFVSDTDPVITFSNLFQFMNVIPIRTAAA